MEIKPESELLVVNLNNCVSTDETRSELNQSNSCVYTPMHAAAYGTDSSVLQITAPVQCISGFRPSSVTQFQPIQYSQAVSFDANQPIPQGNIHTFYHPVNSSVIHYPVPQTIQNPFANNNSIHLAISNTDSNLPFHSCLQPQPSVITANPQTPTVTIPVTAVHVANSTYDEPLIHNQSTVCNEAVMSNESIVINKCNEVPTFCDKSVSSITQKIKNVKEKKTTPVSKKIIATKLTAKECAFPEKDEDYYNEIFTFLNSEKYPLNVSKTYKINLRKRARNYTIVNGNLFHGRETTKKRVLVSKQEQYLLLKQLHIVKETGVHLGVKKMFDLLQENSFWRGMYRDVTNYVKHCIKCTDIKDLTEKPAGPDYNVPVNSDEELFFTSKKNQTSQTASAVWSKVEVKISGPFAITNHNCEYIISITDPISNWIVAEAVPKDEYAQKIVDFIIRTFYTHGFAQCVLTGASKEFHKTVAEDYLKHTSYLKNFMTCSLKGNTSIFKLGFQEDIKCQWTDKLFELLTSNHPKKWDLELNKFLFLFRSGYLNDLKVNYSRLEGSPFKCFHQRLPFSHSASESKENIFSPKFFKNSKSFCKMLQCLHCSEVYSSKIAYLNQYRHFSNSCNKGMSSVTRAKRKNRKSKNLGVQKQFEREVQRVPIKPPIELVENTVTEVKQLLSKTKGERCKRGKYKKLSVKDQEEVTNYASQHGKLATVRKFSSALCLPISESTVRSILNVNSTYTPSLKLEIGRFASNYGIESASKYYSNRLKRTITKNVVKKFRTAFTLNFVDDKAVENKIDEKFSNKVGSTNKYSSKEVVLNDQNSSKEVEFNGRYLSKKVESDEKNSCKDVEQNNEIHSEVKFIQRQNHTHLKKEVGNHATHFPVEETIPVLHQKYQINLKPQTIVNFHELCLKKQINEDKFDLQNSKVLKRTLELPKTPNEIHKTSIFFQSSSNSLKRHGTFHSNESFNLAVRNQLTSIVSSNVSEDIPNMVVLNSNSLGEGNLNELCQSNNFDVSTCSLLSNEEQNAFRALTSVKGNNVSKIKQNKISLSDCESNKKTDNMKKNFDLKSNKDIICDISSKPTCIQKNKKRGSYATHSPEVRAEIAKYAAEHGSVRASQHFALTLGYEIPESTIRGLKDKYLLKRKHCNVTSLGYFQRGRPLRLGKYDAIVQDCLKELIKSGEKVGCYLAIVTAKQILNKCEPSLLEENGGPVTLNVTWAKSFLRRIGVRNNS